MCPPPSPRLKWNPHQLLFSVFRELLLQERPLTRAEETARWPSQNLFNQFKTCLSFNNFWRDSSALTHETHPLSNRKSTNFLLFHFFIRIRLNTIQNNIGNGCNGGLNKGKQLLAPVWTGFKWHNICKCCIPLGAPKSHLTVISPGSLSC